MKLKHLCYCLALAGVGSQLLAAETSDASTEDAKSERITVTGSRIKRTEAEAALPVTVLKTEDLLKQGISSPDQLMSFLNVAGNGLDNLAANEGVIGNVQSPRSGQSSANLRGQGADATLVLLNGRRVSTNGRTGSAVDINTIPMDAIERVEVLRDGASAIYGTDAIGGVINFITKKDFQGTNVSAFADVTQAGGGEIYRGSVVWGMGDADTDGWNVMAALSMRKSEMLRGVDRDFTSTHQPERGLSPDTSRSSFATIMPSNGSLVPGNGLIDPANPLGQRALHINVLGLTGECDSLPNHDAYSVEVWPTSGAGRQYGCAYDYGRASTIQQPQDSLNLVTRATFAYSDNHQAIVEFTGSDTESYKSYDPSQIFGTTAQRDYERNALTQATYDQVYDALLNYFGAASGIGLRGAPIRYRWYSDDLGDREYTTDTESARVLVGFEGSFGDWQYDAGISRAYNETVTELQKGFYYQNDQLDATGAVQHLGLYNLLGSGQINPFLMPGEHQSDSTMAALAAIDAAGTEILSGRSEVKQFDFSISGDLGFGLGAGDIQVATGIDIRKESLKPKSITITQPILNQPSFPGQLEAERDIKALYAEFFIPVLSNLEFTVAGRYDDYSDFGSTTNPKVSFKYDALDSLSFRGAWNTGFRVPTFFQQYSTTSLVAPAAGTSYPDPATCPTHVVSQVDPNCAAVTSVLIYSGGRKELQPETATQKSFGFIWEPSDLFNMSIDWWEIEKEDSIISPDIPTLYRYSGEFSDNFSMGTNDQGEAELTIDTRYDNAGGSITKGAELNAVIKGEVTGGGRIKVDFNGSYIDEAIDKALDSLPYSDNRVGEYRRGSEGALWLRWKHTLSVSYSLEDWSYSITQLYRSGYKDELPQSMQLAETNPLYHVPSEWNPNVASYTLWNFSVGYHGFADTKLQFGIKNLLDKDPPFTAHQNDYSAGAAWEPRVADPRGRAFTVSAEYSF